MILLFILPLILILGYFLFFKKRLIENIYYINRIRDVKRGKHMKNFLQSLNTKGERIEPVPLNDERILKIRGEKWQKHCSLSLTHKLILEKIVNKKCGWYLVFEDDVDLTSEINPENFFKILAKDLEKYRDQDFIYLGICLDSSQVNRCREDSCKGWCTHAYLVKPKGARKLLNNVKTWYYRSIDVIFMQALDYKPVLGYKYTHDQIDAHHHGYMFQNRIADWYAPIIDS